MVICANAPIRATAAVFACMLAGYETRKYVFGSTLTVLAARSYKRIKAVAHLMLRMRGIVQYVTK